MSPCCLQGHKALHRVWAYDLKIAIERLRRQLTLLRWGACASVRASPPFMWQQFRGRHVPIISLHVATAWISLEN